MSVESKKSAMNEIPTLKDELADFGLYVFH